MRATGCPHLFSFKLELASASRWKVTVFCFCFLLARSSQLKKQNGLEVYRNVSKISCAPSGHRSSLAATRGPERSPLWLCRLARACQFLIAPPRTRSSQDKFKHYRSCSHNTSSPSRRTRGRRKHVRRVYATANGAGPTRSQNTGRSV